MSGQNSCIFAGRLGRDAELRYTASGQALAKFSLAVSNRQKSAAGEWKDEPIWVNATLWGDPAENFVKLTQKGSLVVISARYSPRQYEVNGEKKTSHEFTVEGFDVLIGKRKNDGNDDPAVPSEDDMPF